MAKQKSNKGTGAKEWFVKNWLWVVLGLVLVIIIALVIRSNASKSVGINKSPDEGGFTVFGGSGGLDKHLMLSQGSTGGEVSELQKMINNAYVLMSVPQNQITVDGSFGSQTTAALLETTGQSSITLAQAEAKFNQTFG